MKSLWRILRALVVALLGHRGQVDKAGRPYWRHVVSVAWLAYGLTHDVDAVVVGLLHDYLEDVAEPQCPCGMLAGVVKLRRAFGEDTVLRVMQLTRAKEDTYASFIARVAASRNQVVIAVKLADLLHNTMPGRLPRCKSVAEETRAINRLYDYQLAIEQLTMQRTWFFHERWRYRDGEPVATGEGSR
jgi:(p)ppGpp synthase/HD superfamily hydrolase